MPFVRRALAEEVRDVARHGHRLHPGRRVRLLEQHARVDAERERDRPLRAVASHHELDARARAGLAQLAGQRRHAFNRGAGEADHDVAVDEPRLRGGRVREDLQEPHAGRIGPEAGAEVAGPLRRHGERDGGGEKERGGDSHRASLPASGGGARAGSAGCRRSAAIGKTFRAREVDQTRLSRDSGAPIVDSRAPRLLGTCPGSDRFRSTRQRITRTSSYGQVIFARVRSPATISTSRSNVVPSSFLKRSR